MKVLLQAAVFAAKHSGASLVSLVATSGSTPRHAGTFMLVSRSGAQVGTVGGGRVEHEVAQWARQVAAGNAEPGLRTHNLVRDLGMCCGGSMTFFVQALTPCLPRLKELCEQWTARRESCLQIDLKSGEMTLPVMDSSHKNANSNAHFLYCAQPSPRLLLFGCGHLSLALGPLAEALGFEVVLCDDNQTAALDEEPGWAMHCVPSFELRDVEKLVGRVGNSDYLLVLTRDHGIDQRILEAALPRAEELAYLGVIASRGKMARFRKRITAKGIATEAQWRRVHGPIGLDIGAETPVEIAISIVAQLIEVKNCSHSPGLS